MLHWLKSILRESARVGVQAGVYDALTGGRAPLSDEEAAAALLAMIAAATPAAAPPSVGTGPPLAAAAPSDVPALAEAHRRGPGRPRKFQSPPEAPQ